MLNVVQRASPATQTQNVPIGVSELVVSQVGAHHARNTRYIGCCHYLALGKVILLLEVFILVVLKPVPSFLQTLPKRSLGVVMNPFTGSGYVHYTAGET
jgi:hypothetical protein